MSFQNNILFKSPFNRQFPSSENSHFQNELKLTEKTFLVKTVLFAWEKKNHFHITWMASLFETGYGNSVVEHLYFCFAEIKKMKLITGC